MKNKIMIVDDSSFATQVATYSLVHVNVELEVENNPVEAMKYLKNKKEEDIPDLILLDYNMPKMTGFDFIRELKKEENLKYIPIIMISTENSSQVKKDGFKLGVDLWLNKPYSKEELKESIFKVINTED